MILIFSSIHTATHEPGSGPLDRQNGIRDGRATGSSD
jgi:hypothetical protein